MVTLVWGCPRGEVVGYDGWFSMDGGWPFLKSFCLLTGT